MSDQRPPATLIAAKDFDPDFLARMREFKPGFKEYIDTLADEAEDGGTVNCGGDYDASLSFLQSIDPDA